MAYKRLKSHVIGQKVVHKKRVIAKCLSVVINIMVVFALMVMSALFFLFSYDFLTQYESLKTRIIEVEGKKILSSQTIIKQAEVELGVNILLVNLFLAEKRLKKHPWIADADVKIKLPDKIIISIEEQKPVGILDMGLKFIINNKGEIFKELDKLDSVSLVSITGIDYSDIIFSDNKISLPFTTLMDMLQLKPKLEDIFPSNQISRIHLDKEMGITVFAKSDLSKQVKTIVLGFNNYKDKCEKLDIIVSFLENNLNSLDFKFIDLKNLNRVVVHPIIS